MSEGRDRRAVVLAASAALLLAGLLAAVRLPLATRTAVELPRLVVSAAWPGASAELVETFISSPLEAAIQPVRGVRRTSSESREGTSRLTVELEPRADLQLARLAILERLDLLRRELPRGAQPPTVTNYVPEALAERPLLEYALTGPLTAGALTSLVDERIAPRLSAVPGVSGVQRLGETVRRVAVRADPVRLRQLNLAPATIAQALQGARVVQAAGALQRGTQEVPVLLRDEPGAADELLALPIAAGPGRMLRLGDVAVVRQEEDAQGRFYRIDGRSAISLTIARQPQADAIRTAAAVRRVMDSIAPTLPPGSRLRVQSDESRGLAKQLQDIGGRSLGALVLTVLVLVVLLRRAGVVGSILATSVVALAAAALSLYLLGIPANLMTLAGLGMGLGILVQDPLIVAYGGGEFRRGLAARMRPAVLAATLTTAVVLLPFLYLQGDSRAAFLPFAAAFGLALVWAAATALLLLPALVPTSSLAALPRWPRARRGTMRLVATALRWRRTMVVLGLAATGLVMWRFWTTVPRSAYADWYGMRTVLSARLAFPRGSDPRSLDDGMRTFERLVAGRAGVEQVVTRGFRDEAWMSVIFTPAASSTALPWELQETLTQRALLIGGAEVGVYGQGPGFSAGGSGGAVVPFRIKILGYSYGGVEQLANDLKARLEQIPRVRDVDTDAGTFFGPAKAYSVTVEPDRLALARYGLTAEALASAVAREVQGPVTTQRLVVGGEELDLAFKTLGADGRTLDELRAASVTGDASTIRVQDVASVGERTSLGAISREDQQYVRIVSYDFRGPPKLAQRTHKAFMAAAMVPPGYQVADDVFQWAQDDSRRGLWLVGGVGVVLVVLAVAFVYDSAAAALLVLAGVPLALAGVAAAFLLAGATFTREAAVGVVLVLGLSVHQSVLMMDALLRRDGTRLGPRAVLRAAVRRSGMVTGVTLVTLASLVPMALGDGADALSRLIALATAGGTVGGWVFAVVGVPVLMGRGRWRRMRPAEVKPGGGR